MSIQTTFTDMPSASFAGLLADGDDHRVWPMKNADTVSIPFGKAVAFKPSGATSDQDATLPANSTDIIAGIVVKSDQYDRTYSLAGGGTGGELDAVGLVVNAMLNVLTEGVVWATCEDGCTPGLRLWVRYTSAGTGLGTLRSTDAGGSTCLSANGQGKWMTTATAGNLAKLWVDFANKP